MISVLVTGANGQLGMSIQDLAEAYPQIRFCFMTSKQLDITDRGKIDQAFAEHKYHYCINCAAYTNVEQAEKEPEKAFAVNAEGVNNLALACNVHGTVLIHISTDYVFDGKKNEPYTILDEANPINSYGRSKLAGERYIQKIMGRFFIIRTSWLYSQYGHNFYKTVLNKARRNETMSITDAQTGAPTHAKSLSVYIIGLIVSKNRSYGLHHYTDGEVHTWHSFALKILGENQLLGQVKINKIKNYRTFAKRPRYSVLKTTF